MAVTNPRILWPVTIEAGVNQDLDITENAVPGTAVLDAGDFVPREAAPVSWTPATQVPGDILDNVEQNLKGATASANTYSVTISDTGIVTIARATGADAFELLWNTGGAETQALARILGFSTAADDTGATSYVGDYQCRYAWYPEKFLVDGYRYKPSAFSAAADSMGGQTYTQQWMTKMRGEYRIDFVSRGKIRYHDAHEIRALAAVGEDNEAFTTGEDDDIGSGSGFSKDANLAPGFYEWARRGGRFELHPDVTTHDEFVLAVIDPDAAEWRDSIDAAAELMEIRGERYRVTIPWREFVVA